MRQLSTWSSQHFPEAQRLRGWRDALHDQVLEMDALPARREGFFGSIERCALQCLQPHQARGAAQRVLRSASDIARGTRNAYYLISQPRLAWGVAHCGPMQVLRPGDSILIDSREPYVFDFGGGLDDLSIELPLDWVARWLPDPARLVGRPIAGEAGFGLGLRALKEALVPSQLLGRPRAQDGLIEDQLGGLLALLDEGGAELGTGLQQAGQRVLEVMRARFARPGLTAAEVARDAGLSLRTLHRALAAQGQAFLPTLMRLRVEAAAALLAQPRFRRLGVGEIGRRCGFADASHFARQFARHQRVTPQAFRARALG